MPIVTKNGVTFDSTTAEIAAIYGRSVNWARWMARKGRIPHVRFGRDYLFNKAQVDASLIVLGPFRLSLDDAPASMPPDIDEIDFGDDEAAEDVNKQGD